MLSCYKAIGLARIVFNYILRLCKYSTFCGQSLSQIINYHRLCNSSGYCSHVIIPRGVSAHFVRKSRVYQREIASFCDFCASRSVLLVTSSPYWKSLCIFLRIFFRECRSKNADVVVLRRGFLTCAIGEIDRKYAQGFPIRTTSSPKLPQHLLFQIFRILLFTGAQEYDTDDSGACVGADGAAYL